MNRLLREWDMDKSTCNQMDALSLPIIRATLVCQNQTYTVELHTYETSYVLAESFSGQDAVFANAELAANAVMIIDSDLPISVS